MIITTTNDTHKKKHADAQRQRMMGNKNDSSAVEWVAEAGPHRPDSNATTWRDQPAAFCWLFSLGRWSSKSFLCCRKIITAGRRRSDSSNKHTMTESPVKGRLFKRLLQAESVSGKEKLKRVLHPQLNFTVFSVWNTQKHTARSSSVNAAFTDLSRHISDWKPDLSEEVWSTASLNMSVLLQGVIGWSITGWINKTWKIKMHS